MRERYQEMINDVSPVPDFTGTAVVKEQVTKDYFVFPTPTQTKTEEIQSPKYIDVWFSTWNKYQTQCVFSSDVTEMETLWFVLEVVVAENRK